MFFLKHFENKLNIKNPFSETNSFLQITDFAGKIVFKEKYNGYEEIIIDTSYFPAKFYFLQITSYKNTISRKLINS